MPWVNTCRAWARAGVHVKQRLMGLSCTDSSQTRFSCLGKQYGEISSWWKWSARALYSEPQL